MRVEELMSREVVTVGPDTTLKEVATLLARNRISGVPVCDAAGAVLGVVTEADIIRRDLGPERSRGGLSAWLTERVGRDDRRVAARTAGEAMSAPAVTIEPRSTVADAAAVMIGRNVNRLPVLDGGRLVGIVARADLVRAFRRSDEEIEGEISEDVLAHTLWIDPDTVSVVVLDGEVSLGGRVENRTTADQIAEHVRRVPGVVDVHSRLTWMVDDRSHRTAELADTLPRRM